MADRQVLAAVDAEAAAQDSILKALLDLLRWLWQRILKDPYDPRQVDQFTREAARMVQTHRRLAAGATDAYLRRILNVLDVPAGPPSTPVDRDPRGIPATTEWARPVKEYRRARLLGLENLEAQERALQRAGAMADIDLAMARRDAAGRRLAPIERVTGWRRIIHPELSRSGTCGLCIAAADRVYSKAELLPLHARCRCTVAPVIAGQADPGLNLNRSSLDALYEAAGGTAAGQLVRIRYQVEQHGEIGPWLVNAEHHFRGPAEVGQDAPDLATQARAELRALEKTLAELERRASAGEDVVAPMAWQRDRIAALRELVAA